MKTDQQFATTPIPSPPNHRFGRGLLGGKVENFFKFPENTNFILRFIFIIIIVCSSASPSLADFPFQVGEKLFFELRWGPFVAGLGSLEVMPQTTINGQKALHFQAKAKTPPLIDKFYRVRQQLDSFTSFSLEKSLYYQEQGNEGERITDKEVIFDWTNSSASRKSKGKTKKPLTIPDSTFDPLSVFYFFRTQDIKPEEMSKVYVTDGKKLIEGQARVVRREVVKIKAGRFDSWLVEPDIKDLGGVFKKSKKAKMWIWVSADKYKIPLKIKTKVVLGYITVELTKVKGVKLNKLPEKKIW